MGNETKARTQNTEHRLRKLFLIVFLSVFCLLFSVLCLFAQEKKPSKEPTIITSQTLTADNKAKTALFEGAVVAKKGDMTLFADKMMVYYSEEKGSSNIKKIDAEGNVKLLKGERVVTSKFATYFAEPDEKIIFTGEPRALEGDNVITGTKMTYLMKEERSVVENSKVILTERKSGSTEVRK
ncbi:MAG: LptA/OstA family protein [Thermodesulfovibrionales bacterium]|nr:LptA/OstA family protein [Thermodesulfovibrionales bacterium]